ncbi:MAG: pentapeptide repeat-containing protein [Microcoleaceae cyanobacterium]
MAGKLVQKIWKILNTDIELSPSAIATGSADTAKAVLGLAKALDQNKGIKELKPFLENIDSLLDILNSPLAQVVGSTLPFVPIATTILTYIAQQTRSEPTLEDSVLLVGQVAYLESIKQFLKTHPEIQLTETSASEKLGKKIEKLGEFEWDEREAKNALISFHYSRLATEFNSILEKRLQESGLTEEAAKITTERISRDTHRYMKQAVAEVRDSAKRLAGIYGDGWLRDLEVYESIDQYLENIIAKQPEENVFNQDFTFRDIYIPLEVKAVNSDGEVDEDAEPDNIESWAKRILLDENKKSNVLFLQGGPGRGKSVFCKMFSDLVRREFHPIYTPILIRLRDITHFDSDLEKTLETVIGTDFVKTDRGWLTDKNTRFLFLLDGFDELLLERGVSNDLKLFLDQVSQFQKRAANNNERGHRVLITGRPLALYGIERLMPKNLDRVEIIPMNETLQQQWLEKWQTVVNPDPNIAAETVNNFWQFLQNDNCPESVKLLAQEPLILYLLAEMHHAQQLDVEDFKTENAGAAKVLVYQKALDFVLNEQRTKEGEDLNNKILEPESLRSILAEAGLCVVQSGREHTSIKLIEARLKAKEDEAAIQLIEKARKAGSEEGLKNALAAFYLKSGTADNSVEFFHKSFGEFLCAERIAETMAEWTEITKKKRNINYVIPKKELEWQVYDLFGYGHLTAEIVEYLMAVLIQSQIEFVVLFQRLQKFYFNWSEGEFIETTEETLPQKKARQLQQHDIESGQRQVDIYTGLNVLILLLELHRYGQSHEELKQQLHFYPCGQPNSDEFDRDRLLQMIGYSQCLKVNAFLNSVGQFLSSADLSGADLRSANLSGANFRDAHLISANLSGANLSGANLRSAHLRSAHLRSADLSGAHLSFAHLIGADLISADLSDVNLSSADLSGADLSGADLSGAILIDANLRRADLSGAHLSGAHLSGADLSGAHLSDADLSGAHLSNIRWNNDTKWSNIIGLHEATGVSEDLQQQPEFAAAVALSRGYSFAEAGQIEEAVTAYNQAETLNPKLEISAIFWYQLCWFGSLSHHAELVLFAGEKAVELEPDYSYYRTARGLARALTGDFAGAIEDFEAALNDTRFGYNEEEKQKRQGWLAALKTGENPFTDEVLDSLRNK